MTVIVTRVARGIVIARLGGYRLKRYPEGGDCRELLVDGIGWVVADDGDFPHALHRKLRRAMPRHWSMVADSI